MGKEYPKLYNTRFTPIKNQWENLTDASTNGEAILLIALQNATQTDSFSFDRKDLHSKIYSEF